MVELAEFGDSKPGIVIGAVVVVVEVVVDAFDPFAVVVVTCLMVVVVVLGVGTGLTAKLVPVTTVTGAVLVGS